MVAHSQGFQAVCTAGNCTSSFQQPASHRVLDAGVPTAAQLSAGCVCPQLVGSSPWPASVARWHRVQPHQPDQRPALRACPQVRLVSPPCTTYSCDNPAKCFKHVLGSQYCLSVTDTQLSPAGCGGTASQQQPMFCTSTATCCRRCASPRLWRCLQRSLQSNSQPRGQLPLWPQLSRLCRRQPMW